MKSKPKLMTTWIVVIRQNLDDTIAGCYPTVGMARQRMAECLGTPGKPEARINMRTWDNSGLIAVSIFRVRGDKVVLWQQEEFGDEREAA